MFKLFFNEAAPFFPRTAYHRLLMGLNRSRVKHVRNLDNRGKATRQSPCIGSSIIRRSGEIRSKQDSFNRKRLAGYCHRAPHDKLSGTSSLDHVLRRCGVARHTSVLSSGILMLPCCELLCPMRTEPPAT